MNKKNEKNKRELDRELEEGLKGTFPASDPPAVTQPVRRDRNIPEKSGCCATLRPRVISRNDAAEPR